MKVDQCTRSNAHVVPITHLDWTIHSVDFDQQILTCRAIYTLNVPTNELILDTSHLTILGVCDANTLQPLEYKLLDSIPDKPHLGCPLVIIGKNNYSLKRVQVDYETTREGSALQWMTPSQTTSKRYPFCYSQCQAIHARSLIPCQDCTSVKFTYTATVTTPSWATAVLSAIPIKSTTTNDTTTTAVWKQDVPISSYLLAIAVGQLERQSLSKRCAVYSEPELADACKYEFADTELFLKTAEQIASLPYMWGDRYDLLCLPASFAYGGMENPNCTFVTPTLLAGDRSLAGVVAHEIAHSWTGNYVTCQTWDDFFLNEGWTVWLERKIASRIHGSKMLDFQAIGGLADLQHAVEVMPKQFTSLVLPIGDLDPDEAYSSVAYEKGFNFLMYLEKLVGAKAFETFFQAYIREFASKCLTSDDFRQFFIRYFSKDKKAAAAIANVDWDRWFHGTGMPPVTNEFDKSLAESAEQLAQQWVEVDRSRATLPGQDVTTWTSGQLTCFLDALLLLTASQPFSNETIQAMNSLYHFQTTKNCEILFRYCRLAIASEDETVLPIVCRFITTQGRMKYVRPLYTALFHSKMGKELAVRTFLAYKDFYSPVAAKMIASDLRMKHNQTVSDSPTRFLVAAAVACGAIALLAVLRKRR